MKNFFTFLFLSLSAVSHAQVDSSTKQRERHSLYERYSIIGTAAVGIADGYRTDFNFPPGFHKSNVTGFAPLFAKLEYGFYNHISIAATFGYDNFFYNYQQEYTGNSGTFNRYRTNDTRIFSGGITGFYHFGQITRVKHLDPFVGLGLNISNIRYSSYPQNDSTIIKLEHVVTPYLKVGVHYYISSRFALFADAGLDKQSFVTIGASCRFFTRRGNTLSK